MVKLEDLKVGSYIKYDDGTSVEIFVIIEMDDYQITNKMLYTSYLFNRLNFSLDIKFVCNNSHVTLSSYEELHYYNKLEVFQ